MFYYDLLAHILMLSLLNMQWKNQVIMLVCYCMLSWGYLARKISGLVRNKCQGDESNAKWGKKTPPRGSCPSSIITGVQILCLW
jgi:hypothetical protein